MNRDSVADRVLAAVDAAFDRETAFLAALVRSPSDNPPGDCAAHAGLTAGLLERMGFTVERHDVPADAVRAAGMVSATNLIVRERFGDGPVVALNAHGDAVTPGEGWTTDPYGAEIRDGWMYGRGVAVSKSDFATYSFALKALKDAGAPLAGTVELHFTYDEEAGGLIGPQWILQSGLSRPDYAICAGFSYGVTTAHNGCLHTEIRVQGRSAHAAMPESGADALHAVVSVLGSLYAHRERLRARRSSVSGIGSPTLVVGLIEGGINTNVVPDRVTLRVDRRIIPEERPEDAEAELRSLVAGALDGVDGIRWTVSRILLARPFGPVPGQARLADLVATAATRILGEPVRSAGVPLYADARHYAEAGIPTVMYGAGPRTLLEANGHRADERLRLEDLRAASKVLACTLLDLLDKGH